MQISFLKEFKSYLLIVLGILSAGMGLKGYLLSSHFIDGGVTGISMLLNNIFEWPLYILIPLINLPFSILGYFQMGVKVCNQKHYCYPWISCLPGYGPLS